MANIFDDGSGGKSATTTLTGGSSSKDGYQFTGLDNVDDRSIMFDYDFGGNAGKFKVKFRYHNGVAWGPWHYLYYYNLAGDLATEFDSTDGDTGSAEFQLSNQNYFKQHGMRGLQIQMERTSGSNDIIFSNGVEV